MSYYTIDIHVDDLKNDNVEDEWCITPPVSPRDNDNNTDSNIYEYMNIDNNKQNDNVMGEVKHNTIQFSWINTNQSSSLFSFTRCKSYTEWINYMLSR